jgi:hypothetical protein
MHRPALLSLLALAFVPASLAAADVPAAVARSPDEAAVLDADSRQREAVATIDGEAIAAISHPNLRINAPNNRILTGEDLIRMVGTGEIRNEVFERIPEQVTITGDVAVVMGREKVFPGAASEQALMYGQKILNRRYTNVYLRVAGAWRHVARHANIVPQQVASPEAPEGGK